MENLILTTDSLYANGVVIENDDETLFLQREPLEYIPNARDESYTLKQGDTLTNLAGDRYSNSKLWHIIADANPQIIDVFNLQIGLDIRIPYIDSDGY